MAVCALTMLDGVEDEVTAVGGVLLLVLALVLAWLSTHVVDRGDHILGTILTVGAHASLIGLGGDSGYGGAAAEAPEQQAAPPPQENKPDGGEAEVAASNRGDSEVTGEEAQVVGADLLLDIRSKKARAKAKEAAGGEDGGETEEEDEEEEAERSEKYPMKFVSVLGKSISPTAPSPSINVRLKFLNDTEEVAIIEPQDTVERLKSKFFSGREHQVKLIYRGQLLQDPKRTLFSLNVTDNSVIHCHVSQALREAIPEEEAAAAAAQPGAGVRPAGMYISTCSLVVPAFVVALAVVWYFRINYRQFFTWPATISLMGITVFFSFLIFGMHSR